MRNKSDEYKGNDAESNTNTTETESPEYPDWLDKEGKETLKELSEEEQENFFDLEESQQKFFIKGNRRLEKKNGSKSPEETDTDSPSDPWGEIREMYRDGDSKQANYQAFLHLSKKHDLKRGQDGKLYRYDPSEGIYTDDAKDVIKAELTGHDGLQEQFTRHREREIFGQVNNSTATESFDIPEGKVCLENGILDLENVNLQKYTPTEPFTSKLPVEYDPEADCPEFLKMMKQNVPKETARKKLQEFAGYCLHHWGNPYQKALLLLGEERSGKSTFLDSIQAVIGAENVSNQSLQRLSKKFGPASLYGNIANFRNDLDNRMVKNRGVFKEIAGGERITVEKKNQDPFSFRVTQKLLFSCNQIPTVEGAHKAFYRRWILVEFPNTIPKDEVDPELKSRIIENELSGILNWMLEGYLRLQNQEYFTGERSITEMKSIWKENGDSLDRFTEKFVVQDSNGIITTDGFMEEYRDFADEIDMGVHDKSTVTNRLKKIFDVEITQRRIHGERPRCYVGISLETNNNEDDEVEEIELN